MAIIHNPTIDTLLNRRTIRQWTDQALSADEIETIETAAQRAATSQFLNAWSAIRITDKDIALKLASIGNQPYVAQAGALYIFIIDNHRNVRIAREAGIDDADMTFDSDYTFTQGQNDAVLALHAMETAAESLGLGTVILGCILNDSRAVIDTLHLPEYTVPVLGLAIGHPAQEPTLKPRMPRELQFFNNVYPDDSTTPNITEALADFDNAVSHYYDLRFPDQPVHAFTEQVVAQSTDTARLKKSFGKPARAQGFTGRSF
ncbi:NADPH-dependent oxidoreductase [Alloscardovia theropitheci]|uniref:NADPH-dependent oxidoreductase n=1 Tax=Alloscardovia theropitheci TaxID=2496842 RepID=A0A4R0QRX9_9BIFI|nr:nitroreductase family protein [Alloscardovia theropitheci]TCD53825.1 NADPH-dependent oxidoreductase [Alloscardovia theropitheci]